MNASQFWISAKTQVRITVLVKQGLFLHAGITKFLSPSYSAHLAF